MNINMQISLKITKLKYFTFLHLNHTRTALWQSINIKVSESLSLTLHYANVCGIWKIRSFSESTRKNEETRSFCRLKIQSAYHIQYLQFKFGNYIFFWCDFEITFFCTNFAQDWITNPGNFQNSLISLFFCRDSENYLIFSVLTLEIGSEKNRKLSSKIGKISYDLTLWIPGGLKVPAPFLFAF
jgi:hypothetical protein